MTYKQPTLVGLYAMILTVSAGAQVTGSGTPNTIPLFTDNTVIGNSGITQSAAGFGFAQGVGIGNTAPIAGVTLDMGEGVADPKVAIKNANDPAGGFLGNTFGIFEMGMFNPTSSAVGGVPANTFATFFAMNAYGQIGSVAGSPFGNAGIRNYLDDGSGNGSVKSSFSAANIILYPPPSGGGSITFPDATYQSTAWNGVLSGGDYAESVNVSGLREEYEPGDVLVIDPAFEGNFLRSSAPYSTAVTGIYSTKPGVVGRRQLTARAHMKEEVPMAMTGIVPTKVSAENGPIRPGDLLVTSSKAGCAMKGTDRTLMLGAVIGKAIGHLDAGLGVIEVVVTLQ